MSANSTHEFPAPVGGVPEAFDFLPSIVFAALYASLIPIVVWRMAHPRSRTTVLIGTSGFTIERVVSFSLRAKAARDAAFRANTGVETYFQTSYSGAFIAIGQDLVNLLRALLVASTLGSDMLARRKLTPPHVRKAQKQLKKRTPSQIELAPIHHARASDGEEPGEGEGVHEVELGEGDAASARTAGNPGRLEFEDQTMLRKTMRTWLGVAVLLFLIAVVVSGVAGGIYKEAVQGSTATGTLVRSLSYVSTVLAIILLVGGAFTALCACYKLPRVPRTSALLIVLVAGLLTIIGAYRITVISHSTTSLFSTAPGSQNSTREKILFYALHVAPEYVSVAILVSLNARRVFGTGPWGDIRASDPKPKATGTAEGESGSLAQEPAPSWLRLARRLLSKNRF